VQRGANLYKNQFVDEDLGQVVAVLVALTELLPNITMLNGPSEDTPSPFNVDDLPGMIEHLAGLQSGNVQQHMAGLDLRVRTLLADNRITPLIAPEGEPRPLGEWLHDLLGSGENGRGQISVIDLSLVPSDVLTTLVAVLGRLVFETAQRYRRIHRATLPTVLVLEEAHNFIQRQGLDLNEKGSATRCRQMFEKIAKEGRKFGVGLMLSSQRPAELSATIIAQCNSFLLHRIVNDRDQELIGRLAPDTSGSLLKELPSLPQQKAIVMGIAAEIPLVFDIRELPKEQRPNSENPDFWSVWTGERQINHDLSVVTTSWTGE
jgi:DNA helicase HerA-like ATPase